jgi:hypothetical protein
MTQRIWSWITVALGAAVIVLTYIQAALEGVWFDDHGVPDDINSFPEFALGLIGLLLIVGGLVAALRKTPAQRR